ncbi:hypothetical protein BC835DRAFT_315993 [Cytidiella melzeri]|nr:hypothetical protein BC835DRAFT_315993 [Cytidiella melzeri]
METIVIPAYPGPDTTRHASSEFFPILDVNSAHNNTPSTSPLSHPISEGTVSKPTKQENVGGIMEIKVRPRRRLPQEASMVLQHYYENISAEPALLERKDLLAVIRSIPGAEWYTTANLHRWFKGRGRLSVRGGSASKQPKKENRGASRDMPACEDKPVTTANILWPTLDALRISKLAVLTRENPQPDAAVLQVWSRALKAEVEDVYNWVQLNGLTPASVKPPSTPEPTSPYPKVEMYSPTECVAMLPPESPVERKPFLPAVDLMHSSVARAQSNAFSQDDNSFGGDTATEVLAVYMPPYKPGSFTSQPPATPVAVPVEYYSPQNPTSPLPASAEPTVPATVVTEAQTMSSKHTVSIPTKQEPRRHFLAELATFVEERVSCTASHEMVLQDFNRNVQASEAFFEKIKSGAYSSLGLVFCDVEPEDAKVTINAYH